MAMLDPGTLVKQHMGWLHMLTEGRNTLSLNRMSALGFRYRYRRRLYVPSRRFATSDGSTLTMSHGTECLNPRPVYEVHEHHTTDSSCGE